MTRERDPNARWALVAFGCVLLGAFVFFFALGRRQWFFADEWEFLSARGGGDLLRAHYGHLVALPIVLYRVLWQVVGLRSYAPYVGLAITLHLVAAALLWVVMRRPARVRPWTATVAASVFALFGAGAQDILWAFQITFTGALVFGLAHLLLADHDGPVDARDWLGLVAGLLGLMCSGVAVTMVIVVGVSTLLRRSWRAAALHTVPLGVIYGAWWLRYSSASSFRGTPREIFDWFTTGAGAVFGEVGSVRGVGWLVAAVLVAGGVLVVRRRGAGVAGTQLALPLALLIGAGVFLMIAGFDRGGIGSAAARSSRYLHILAALMLPAIAVAIDTLLDRSRVFGVAAVAVLIVGVPGNIANTTDYSDRQRLIDNQTRQIMLSVPRDPLAREVPPALRPEPNRAPTVTLGWLFDGIASGRIPNTRAPSAFEARTNRLRLSLMELDEPSANECRPLRGSTTVRMQRGDELGLNGRAAIVLVDGPGVTSGVVLFGNALLNPSVRHALVAVADPLTLRIAPVGRLGASLCPAPAG